MTQPILEIINLSKHFLTHWTFKKIKAVNNLSLKVEKAESFGFLGHNGAGKTTTIKCIVGLIAVNSGCILLNGEVIKTNAQKVQLAYLPEQPYFYDQLTVEETMDYFASLYGLRAKKKRLRITECLDRLEILSRAKSSVRSLSKGLQQRLGIAQAILNKPELLLLDEPFSGLDPLGRKHIRDLILELRKQGTTIFMSSHILSDVEDVCDRVAIMAKGELKDTFSLAEMPKLFGQSYEIECACLYDKKAELDKVKSTADWIKEEELSDGLHLILRFKKYAHLCSAIEHNIRNNIQIHSVRTITPSLEEVFVQITTGTK